MDIIYKKIGFHKNKLEAYSNNAFLGMAFDFTGSWRKKTVYDIYVENGNKDIVLENKFNDLPSDIQLLSIPIVFKNNFVSNWILGNSSMEFVLIDYWDGYVPRVSIIIQADTDNWEKPYSLGSRPKIG